MSYKLQILERLSDGRAGEKRKLIWPLKLAKWNMPMENGSSDR